MGARLVPAYVERPAWAVYRAYCEMMSEDGNDGDFDALRDALTELRDGLLRGQAVAYAPDDVLDAWLGVGGDE